VRRGSFLRKLRTCHCSFLALRNRSHNGTKTPTILPSNIPSKLLRMAVTTAQPLAEASSTTAGPSSSAAVFKRLHPSQYLSRFLAKDYRPDGRKSRAWRDVSVNAGASALTLCSAVNGQVEKGPSADGNAGSISTADGSALVRMGDTTMVCGIKAEVAEPDMVKPDEGFLGGSALSHSSLL